MGEEACRGPIPFRYVRGLGKFGGIKMLAQVVNEMEFRGKEDKSFSGDDGKSLNMTLYRFEDENGLQNNFYVMDPSTIEGLSDLVDLSSISYFAMIVYISIYVFWFFELLGWIMSSFKG